MASITPIPPAIAALFAARVLLPAPAVAKAAVRTQPAIGAIVEPPRRNLRRGSLLDLLI